MGLHRLLELSSDPRFASQKAFFQWAMSRWATYTGQSPLAIKPIRRGYAEVSDETGRPIELYAGLYPTEAFEDLIDFCLWEAYISSLHQSLLRDEEPDMGWFSPPTPKEGVAQAWEAWESSRILQGGEIQDWFATRRFPESIGWLAQFHHRLARVNEDKTGTVLLLGAAQEGYSVLLAIRALTAEEVQAMFFTPFIDINEWTKK